MQPSHTGALQAPWDREVFRLGRGDEGNMHWEVANHSDVCAIVVCTRRGPSLTWVARQTFVDIRGTWGYHGYSFGSDHVCLLG